MYIDALAEQARRIGKGLDFNKLNLAKVCNGSLLNARDFQHP